MVNFDALPENNNLPINYRKSVALLPAGVGFTSETNLLKKFLGTTLDQWIQPARIEDQSGYIGQRSGLYYDPSGDFYLNEKSVDRAHYQLEPSAASIDNNQNINFVGFYQDLVNHLKFQGSLTNNHNRLFSQEYYSWAPPINIDMFINFSNYYWLVPGPTLVEISDPTNAILEIIGQEYYTTLSDIEFVSGMKVQFLNDANIEFNNRRFIVEGVGQSIRLIDDSVYDSFGLYDVLPYDDSPYDSVEGSFTPDYITISRGCKDKNPWSRNNRWFHKDLIQNLNLADFSSFQARRPIIEFYRDIELYNYGRVARKDVTLFSDSYSVYDLTGQSSFNVDGVEVSDGDRILFVNDPDPIKNNRIYRVFGIEAYGQIGLILETDGLDLLGSPIEGEKVLVKKGNVFKNREFWFNGEKWLDAQSKYVESQEPLFNLYDHSRVKLDDKGVYPGSTFSGSKIFAYVKDETQIVDQYLGFGINFDTFGNIQFENLLNTEVFTYNLNFQVEPISGYYYFKKITDDNFEIYLNEWVKADTESKQYVRDDFILNAIVTDSGLTEFKREFILSIEPDTNVVNEDKNFIVYLNGVVLDEGVDYSLNSNLLELSMSLVINDGDVLEVYSYADHIDKVEGAGYFEIPRNLEANPVNEEIDIVKFSDIRTHFISIIQNQPNFRGLATGSNNFNSSPRNLSKGKYIQQHTAPLLLTMLLSSQSNSLDVLTSIQYASKEYSRFKKKFINKIKELYTKGYTDSIPAITWVKDALMQINVGKTDIFPFAYSNMAGGMYYIPSTPAALGILPVFQPERFVDVTRLTPVEVIRGHDGSITNTFGNYLDDVLLELEMLIYDNIVSDYKEVVSIRELDYLTERPGYFRDTDYSRDEWLQLSKPAFERWVVDEQIDYSSNLFFDEGNRFTWNYSRSHGPDGSLLPGGWRAIYEYFYDTDRPHTHPWEMLGFSQKPIWWDSEYGLAPYTGANIQMWQDLEQGRIAQGPNSGIHTHLSRSGLLKVIPVDEYGNLLDPISAGIVQDVPNLVDASNEWVFGDIGPGEYNWRVNSSYNFALTEALYLARPNKFINLFWAHDLFTRTQGQYVDDNTFKRRKISDYQVHNEVDDQGVRQIRYGISQWVSDYLLFLGKDIHTTFGNIVRDLTVRLMYKVGGFTKSNSLRLLTDSFGLLPQENITVKLFKSNSVEQLVYSGVIIEWDGSSYRVAGYDTIGQRFKVIPGLESGSKSEFIFNEIQMVKYNTSSKIVKEILYGEALHSRQAVFNFLLDYQRYLESEGWVFDQIEPISNKINDFSYAAEQFIEWTTNSLVAGDAIIFSPLANKAKIVNTYGHIDNIQRLVNGVYSVIDRDAIGIQSKSFDIDRNDNEFSVTINADVQQGIYGLRLSVIEYEHILVIDNVTKFNDLIYAPLLGLRQPRLRAFIQKTVPWDGKAYALGFIIQDDGLIDNFEKSVSDIEEYFSIDNLEDTSLDKQIAKHLIGYQDRDYLDNLLLSKKSQYQFYQGFIKEKGTDNSFKKILRNSYVTQTADFNVLEEWAFLLGEYGNVTHKSSIQLKLAQGDFKTNPQQIEFVGDSDDNFGDNIISITPDDPRWVLKRPINTTVDQFQLRGFINEFRSDLPNSGYIRTDEATYSIVYKKELETLYEDLQLAGRTLSDGDIVWNIISPNSSWDAFRLCSISKISEIEAGASVGDPAKITLEATHDLQPGDIIYIIASTQSSPDFEGYQIIYDVVGLDAFLIDVPVETPKSFNSGEGPMVLVVRSVRFSNTVERDAFVPINGWNSGDRVWVDLAINDRWSVYEWNGIDWDAVRIEEDKIKIEQVYNVFLYNNRSNLVDIQLNLIDPFKGFISASADVEIYYKLGFDPAKYTNGDGTVFQIDPEQSWSNQQVGRLWWDLTTVRFLNYEQDDIEYRVRNWGKLAPGTTVDIYEWIRSPVPPSGWDSYISSAPAITTFRPSGELKYGVDQPYVVRSEYNTENGRFESVYYFWVKNPAFIPANVGFRKLSALAVSNLISYPNTQNIPWFAPISTNSFLLSNVDMLLSDDSVLQINFYDRSLDSVIHKQWKLVQENDSVNSVDIVLWNKMRDSLVGYDDLGLVVPATNLSDVERYGNKIRPRQTWFKDRQKARVDFVQKANKLLLEKNVVDGVEDWDTYLHLEDPEPLSSEYDYKVFNRNDRTVLEGTIPPGKKVLVESDQVYSGKWSLWQYDGSNFWTLISKQLYRVEDFWEFIDWYADGYSAMTRIDVIFSDILARNAGEFNIGDIVKVLDNGNGVWTLYRYEEQNATPVFILIGQEQGTIKFSNSLCDYDVNDAELDQEASLVLKEVIKALRENLLDIIEQNQLFFTMVHYVHTEQFILDWVFKTSYIYGLGNADLLKQDYIFTKDQSQNLLNYLNEAKPYHVKIRGLIEQKEAKLDEANVHVLDSHNFQINLMFDRITCESLIPDGANPKDYDISILSAADRIQLLYKPTEGMPEKVLDQLISRCEYGGTILDGKNFYQFGTSLAAGYDASQYDSFFGYDFDASDIETFYDVFVNGGEFNTPAPTGLSDIIVDGYRFIQPNLAEHHPAELVDVRSGDAVIIDVYTTSSGGQLESGFDGEGYDIYGYDYDISDIAIPFGGRPKVRVKRYTSDGTAGTYSVGQTPQNKQSLFVYVAGALLREGTGYTVNWGDPDPLVTLLVTPLAGNEIILVSFTIGGSTVLKRKTIRNTNDTIFDLGVSFGSDEQVFITVDGEIATFTSNGTEITITSPIPSNSTVFIVIFENSLYSKILTQEEIAVGGVETFTINRPASSTDPVNYATTIVHKNGLRLAPPYIKLYTADGIEQYFKVGTGITSAANVRVWIDDLELAQPTDFTVLVSDSEVQLIVPPAPNSKVVIMLVEGNEFEITGVNNDQLTVLDGLGSPLVLTTGDSIKVTTFSEDLSLGMRTEVFNGNALAFYPLGMQPYDTNSIWVTVNGEKQIHLNDYVLADKDQGYDSEYTGYGILYDNDLDFGVNFKSGVHSNSDRVIVTYFTNVPIEDPIAFRLFKNIFGNWQHLRISDMYSTRLVQSLNSNDTEIVVEDSTVLGQPDISANIPGVIFINGERIIFWEVDTTTPGAHILKRVLRGSSGTGINEEVPINTTIRDASRNQIIPGGYYWSYSPNGLQLEKSTLTKFLLSAPGTYDYTV